MAEQKQIYEYIFMGIEYIVEIEITKYNNNRPAIIVKELDLHDNLMEWTATINLPDQDISEDFVAIKTYQENEGLMEFLLKHHIIAPPVRTAHSGYCQYPICPLLVRQEESI